MLYDEWLGYILNPPTVLSGRVNGHVMVGGGSDAKLRHITVEVGSIRCSSWFGRFKARFWPIRELNCFDHVTDVVAERIVVQFGGVFGDVMSVSGPFTSSHDVQCVVERCFMLRVFILVRGAKDFKD